MHWLMSLWSWWFAWHQTWNGKTAMDASSPYLVTMGALLGAGFGFYYATAVGESFKDTLLCFVGWGFGGAIVGLVLAIVIGVLPMALMVILAVSTFLALFSGLFYARDIGKALRKIPTQKMMSWVRRVIRKRKPEDYLYGLDQSAQEVEKRLNELNTHRQKMSDRESKLQGRVFEARKLKSGAKVDSAAHRIAGDVLGKFERKLANATASIDKLREIITQIKDGQREMQELISLARLCRQAGEADITEDVQAIEAARKALDALRKAFEQADAVLSAAVAESDMDLELAFQHDREAVQRNSVPVPRVRA